MKEKRQQYALHKSISAIESVLGMMACVSLILIFMPKDWVQKHLEFEAAEYPVTLSDDHYNGGSSIASWVNEKARHMRCEMGSQYANPYCNMTFNTLSDTWNGIDLRGYSEMTIWGRYTGDAEYIRIYLRNRHPRYYVREDDTSTKYNMVEIPVGDLQQGLRLNMKDFGVADWWLTTKSIPLEYSHPEFNDIIFIEVQTASQVRSGTHEIQLDKILWSGNLISDAALYKGIIIVWSVFIFSLLFFRIVKLKVELSRNQNYQKELISINKFLNLQNKQFEDLAKTDHLTGCLNRIGIRDALYDGLQNWKDKRTPFSFMLIDLDNFKLINDGHGHDIGDRILQGVAELLKNHIRRTDLLARWGGEEFMLVCPNSDLNQATVVAELLRKKLQETSVYPDIAVTASFGVATMTHPDLDELFKCADEALYEAKANGRNQVVCKS